MFCEGDLVKLKALYLPEGDPLSEKLGFVTDTRCRWPGGREEERLVKILFIEDGIEEEWSEYDLEMISAGR